MCRKAAVQIRHSTGNTSDTRRFRPADRRLVKEGSVY
jgi:hypothetical protein